jgi:hypothetical protein
MRGTGAACLTVALLVALYVVVVRLQSVSPAHHATSTLRARLVPSQRVQGLLIPVCSFRLLETSPAWHSLPGVRPTELVCISPEPLRIAMLPTLAKSHAA